MNTTPKNLIGKTIVDCYESDTKKLTLEFNDGTKITLNFDAYLTVHHPRYGTIREAEIDIKPR